MVADTLKILCDHQQIKCKLAVTRIGRNAFNQILLDTIKIIVNNIILSNNFFCKFDIAFHKCLNAVCDHFCCRLCHFVDISALRSASAVQKGNYFRYILGLITDAFHIGYHLERCGNLTKIPCNRLLTQQQFETECLYIAFHFVNFVIDRCNPACDFCAALGKCLCGKRDRFLTQCSHFNKLIIELPQLAVKTASHHPNLPVI